MSELHIYTDGGSSGNPGPGGWAYVILSRSGGGEAAVLAEASGGEAVTTNHRMELLAVISALESLAAAKQTAIPEEAEKQTVSLFTDSQYVQKGITVWIKAWKQNGWRTRDRQPVKNQDLWQRLDALAAQFPIAWQWVKGHAGNTYNERCDALVQQAIDTRRRR
ncbi:MAG: ribonuclease HI [Treponema sp.]|nr:ribonuclease HI [Treponema sp.]